MADRRSRPRRSAGLSSARSPPGSVLSASSPPGSVARPPGLRSVEGSSSRAGGGPLPLRLPRPGPSPSPRSGTDSPDGASSGWLPRHGVVVVGPGPAGRKEGQPSEVPAPTRSTSPTGGHPSPHTSVSPSPKWLAPILTHPPDTSGILRATRRNWFRFFAVTLQRRPMAIPKARATRLRSAACSPVPRETRAPHVASAGVRAPTGLWAANPSGPRVCRTHRTPGRALSQGPSFDGGRGCTLGHRPGRLSGERGAGTWRAGGAPWPACVRSVGPTPATGPRQSRPLSVAASAPAWTCLQRRQTGAPRE